MSVSLDSISLIAYWNWGHYVIEYKRNRCTISNASLSFDGLSPLSFSSSSTSDSYDEMLHEVLLMLLPDIFFCLIWMLSPPLSYTCSMVFHHNTRHTTASCLVVHVCDTIYIAHIPEVAIAHGTRDKRTLPRIRRCPLWRSSFPAKIAWADFWSPGVRRCSLWRGAHI
jgi:hypothetical protein